MKIKTRLRTDWKKAHKWAGMRLTALAGSLAALQQAWPSIPWTGSLPHWVPSVLAWGSVASVVGAVGRRVTKTGDGEGQPK